MKAIMIMFDSLNRHMLNPYGFAESITPNFTRLRKQTVRFDRCFIGSFPCMPARRELHTGRYNFLHRSWGPIEPFDDSMPELLKRNGVYSHLVSDHTHYWEDGGATYHTRYSTWECFRGQEGDPWKGVVGGVPDQEPNLIQFSKGHRGDLYRQDLVNRTYLNREEDHPQTKTFEAGMEFIRTNAHKDRWFLHLETFDPHEPFFSYEKYKSMYSSDYQGPRFDWPDYAAVKESPEEVAQARREYLALLSMCDHYLGQVLDVFDDLDLWKDTLLIVNTDHGFLLGEHDFWAKHGIPLYNEISHTPLFVWDPRYGVKNECRDALVQTIDLAPTILDFFDVEIPADMEGRPLSPVIQDNSPIRKAGLFGIYGWHVCVTDGRYVYMKAPVAKENKPLYEYTLMPTHMTCFFSPDKVKSMEMSESFRFTKDMPIMRFVSALAENGAYDYGDLLFDLEEDPGQEHPITDNDTLLKRMEGLLVELMEKNDAPEEQYVRLGLR